MGSNCKNINRFNKFVKKIKNDKSYNFTNNFVIFAILSIQ